MHETNNLDLQFFQCADDFFSAHSHLGLTYDDVSLATLYSEILPRETLLNTRLAEGLELNIPIISSDMDTVTESRMAIGMALNGGLGLIHYNMTEKEQIAEVNRVKGHIHGLIQDPVTIAPDKLIGDLLQTIEREKYTFSTFPVVDAAGKILGMLPAHVINTRYAHFKVTDVIIPRSQISTILQSKLGPDAIVTADKYFMDHPMEHKLMVVDDSDRLRGLFTLSDILRINQERSAQIKPARDSHFRLLCGAAIPITRDNTGNLDKNRILAHVSNLLEKSVDVVAVSTAHGFTRDVGNTVRLIREAFPSLPIIAGNVTSGAGVEFLAEAGANIIKIGQGPGSICSTRIVAGVGIPHTVIADNAGGHLMQHREVDAVIVGADRITAIGDVANKVGTYLKALAAKDMDVPFYVAAPSSTIDWTIQDGKHGIEIENRSGDELRFIRGLDKKGHLADIRLMDAQTNVENPAFDVTPARLVTGIITERGVCAPEFLTRLFPEGARKHARS